jgi:hypothetical protein
MCNNLILLQSRKMMKFFFFANINVSSLGKHTGFRDFCNAAPQFSKDFN